MAKLPITIEAGVLRNSFHAFAGKRLVGAISAWNDCDGRFVVLNVGVRKQYQRRGIARMMYQAVEQASGKMLTPAHSLSDDGFEFWKRFRPDAVALDLRHHAAALIGKRVAKNGKDAEIYKVSGSVALIRYADGSTSFLRRDAIEHLIGSRD